LSGASYTYGQVIPGLPWYDYLDPGKKSLGLDHLVFHGLRRMRRIERRSAS